ncbi:hypothetical protein BKA61DRAFT_117577 [Leptodontidium sp. MPI-SDFR-AT-0119]|nr:hypothetical protein BKA61DRAFT_117577 [Leptodontidium sp. MPI-SDFR-AT-0119]
MAAALPIPIPHPIPPKPPRLSTLSLSWRSLSLGALLPKATTLFSPLLSSLLAVAELHTAQHIHKHIPIHMSKSISMSLLGRGRLKQGGLQLARIGMPLQAWPKMPTGLAGLGQQARRCGSREKGLRQTLPCHALALGLRGATIGLKCVAAPSLSLPFLLTFTMPCQDWRGFMIVEYIPLPIPEALFFSPSSSASSYLAWHYFGSSLPPCLVCC